MSFEFRVLGFRVLGFRILGFRYTCQAEGRDKHVSVSVSVSVSFQSLDTSCLLSVR